MSTRHAGLGGVEVIGGRALDTSALGTHRHRPLGLRPFLEVLRGRPNTVLEVLDGSAAHEVGLLLAGAASWP